MNGMVIRQGIARTGLTIPLATGHSQSPTTANTSITYRARLALYGSPRAYACVEDGPVPNTYRVLV